MSKFEFWALMAQLTVLNISNIDLKGITFKLRRQVRTVEDFLSDNFQNFKREEKTK